MTFPADQPVVSGQSYTVPAVDGHRSADLTDFVGTIAVTLVRDGHRHRLIGDGAATSGTIRFHQKDPGPDDKDIRVWTITDRCRLPRKLALSDHALWHCLNGLL